MSSEYGSDFITITDEEGNQYELEHIGTIEFQNEIYMAFLPADIAEDSEDYGIVILKVEEVDNEEQFVTVDDEDTLDQVYQSFMEQLFDDYND